MSEHGSMQGPKLVPIEVFREDPEMWGGLHTDMDEWLELERKLDPEGLDDYTRLGQE